MHTKIKVVQAQASDGASRSDLQPVTSDEVGGMGMLLPCLAAATVIEERGALLALWGAILAGLDAFLVS
jgi:hypothetical protein